MTNTRNWSLMVGPAARIGLRSVFVGAVGLLGIACIETAEDPVKNTEPYGPAYDENLYGICRSDEIGTLSYPSTAPAPEFSICSAVCESVADCPDPRDEWTLPAGQLDCLVTQGTGSCVLRCDASLGCPSGLVCTPAMVCMWPLD